MTVICVVSASSTKWGAEGLAIAHLTCPGTQQDLDSVFAELNEVSTGHRVWGAPKPGTALIQIMILVRGGSEP